MPDWIRNVDSSPEDRHSLPTLFEGGPMRCGIDSARHPAYDRDAASNQRPRQRPGDALAIRGRVSGANDRDARLRQRRRQTDCKELTGWMSEVGKLARVVARIFRPALNSERWRSDLRG